MLPRSASLGCRSQILHLVNRQLQTCLIHDPHHVGYVKEDNRFCRLHILRNFITRTIGKFTRLTLNGNLPGRRMYTIPTHQPVKIRHDTFLTRQCQLLSTQYYSKDLIVDHMGVSSTPATWECKENNTKAPRKRCSRGESQHNRSRSSPVRTALSENSSLERRARSPSVSAKLEVLPKPQELPVPTVLAPHDSLFTSQITPGLGISATSYFSPIPPSMPLYIVPLPPSPSAIVAQIEKNIRSQHQSKVKARNKTGRRIARQLLYSILKNLPINTENENVGVEAVEVKIAVEVKEPAIYPRSNRSIATQALSKYGNNRKFLTHKGDECSSSESSDGCEWAGSVRALRNSHVRLVLRQLRHLRDIERLSRALYREHGHE